MAHAAVTAKAASMHTAVAQARFVHNGTSMYTAKRAWLRTHAAGTVAPFACYASKFF